MTNSPNGMLRARLAIAPAYDSCVTAHTEKERPAWPVAL